MTHIFGGTQRESTIDPSVTKDGPEENQQTGEALDGAEARSQDEELVDETLEPKENDQNRQSDAENPAPEERPEDAEENDQNRQSDAETPAPEERPEGV